MEQLISQIFLIWGPVGILIIAASWILYNHLLNDWKHKSNPGAVSQEYIKDLKDTIVHQIDTSLEAISDKVDLVNEKIEMVNTRVNDMNDRFDERIDDLENRINTQSSRFIKDIEKREQAKLEEHNKQMNDLLILGPKMHKILADYIDEIQADHIFLGSFHNGSYSISGIPYYKFDIIAERFTPAKHGLNKELAPIYKDSDILRHNRLPSMLIEQGQLFFSIKGDNSSKLDDIDSILYNKFIRVGVKQFAVNVLKDGKGRPSGFIGCVKYEDSNVMNLDKLKLCADTLEGIYHVNEKN